MPPGVAVRIEWDDVPFARCLAHPLSDHCCYSCLLLALFPPPSHSCPRLPLNLPPHGLHETDPHLTWHVSLPFPPVSIQMVSTSNASQTVTLVYVVGNRSSFLNGTVASSLLRQLSAELVGFYLTYPLLTIAKREYVPILQGLCHLLQGLVCLAKLSARPHANPLVIKSLLWLKYVVKGDLIDEKFIAHWKKYYRGASNLHLSRTSFNPHNHPVR